MGQNNETLIINKRDFITFWVVSAYRTGIPGNFSAVQLKRFQAALGVDFSDAVEGIDLPDFMSNAEARFDAAVADNEGQSNG